MLDCICVKNEGVQIKLKGGAMPKINYDRTRELLEILRNFRLLDDTFFSQCFDGSNECMELILRIILDIPDLKVLKTNTQKNVKNLMLHEARLDAYAEDSKGNAYDIEVQRSDAGAEKRRARFYSSMLDSKILGKGRRYRNLPDSYVIFITENDVMRLGDSVYRIERCIMNNGKEFSDGSHIVYVNGSYRDDSSPIGRLMHDFACRKPEEMHYKVLADKVRYYKESKEGVDTMCKAMENLVRKERAEGKAEEKKERILRLLLDGTLPVQKIASIYDLQIEDVEKIQREYLNKR